MLTELEEKGTDLMLLCKDSTNNEHFYHSHGKLATKCVDFSSAFRKSKDFQNVWSFDKTDPRPLSLPGCSAWGILSALWPLKELLPNRIFADVKFSKSSLRYGSPHEGDLLRNVYVFEHYHQKEVNDALGKDALRMNCAILDVGYGLSIGLMFEGLEGIDYKKTLIENNSWPYVKIVEDWPDTKIVSLSGDILLCVKQIDRDVCINVVMDNLVNDRYLHFL